MFESGDGPINPKKARSSLAPRSGTEVHNTILVTKNSDMIDIDSSSATTSVSDSSEPNGLAQGSHGILPWAPADNIQVRKFDNRSTQINQQQMEDLKKWGTQDDTSSHFGSSTKGDNGQEVMGALEVFCGCARMTKELRDAGFDAFGIDYGRNKDKPETKSYFELDLSKPWGINELYKIINEKKVKITFMAPPCGSASAARLIRRKKGPDPKPLRSHEHPDGLPGLNFADKERVSIANKLYDTAAALAYFCEVNGISWVIENPTNSLMWKTSPFTLLFEKLIKLGSPPQWCNLQMCMHGGARDKKTSLLYGGKISLEELAVMCDHSHTHKPWGLTKTPGTLWATAEERNYPRTFCKRVAKIFQRALKPNKGKKAVKQPKTTLPEKTWAGSQPRRNFNDLVPEFKEVLAFTGATEEQMKMVKQDDAPFPRQCGNRTLSNVGKILDSRPEQGGDGSRHQGTVGVYRTSLEFLDLAMKCTHPFDDEIKVPQRVAQVIYEWALHGPEQIEQHREKTLAHYERRAKELQREEDELHAKLDKDVQEVIKDKRILLFKEMLSNIKYDDMSVVELLTLGVRVVGLCQNTGIWQSSDEKLPKTTIKHLWASAKDAQKQALSQSSKQEDSLTQKVWEITAGKDGEVEAGLLRGPFTPQQISDQVGNLWVPARRFGLQQGTKVRPVDDFSQFGINRAFGSEQKVSILSIDHVVAWTRAVVHSEKNGVVSLLDGQGCRWQTGLHHKWAKEDWGRLRGRVADLKNAYKQVAVAPEHKAFNIIAVYDPTDKQTKLFRALALMFGQTSAVYAFLRISRAIAALGARLLSLLLVEYFDDFTQVEPEKTGDSAQAALERLLDLIGWKVADTEAKRKPFAQKFTSLGVKLNFESTKDKVIIVEPKDGRVESIIELANKILDKGNMNFKEALSLKGKLQFAEGQLFYRVTAAICRLLSRWASTGGWRPLTEEMRAGLKMIEPALSSAGPRMVQSISEERPIVIFTDGACEPQGTTVGGVLIVPGLQIQAFGGKLTKVAAESLAAKEGQRQVIGQAELLPLLVAKTIWREFLSNRKVIYFMDNDGSRQAVIKGYSPVITSLRIILKCAHSDAVSRSTPWYARVPTKSNIGDEPSRMRKSELIKLGAKIVKPYLHDDGGMKWFSDVLR